MQARTVVGIFFVFFLSVVPLLAKFVILGAAADDEDDDGTVHGLDRVVVVVVVVLVWPAIGRGRSKARLRAAKRPGCRSV